MRRQGLQVPPVSTADITNPSEPRWDLRTPGHSGLQADPTNRSRERRPKSLCLAGSVCQEQEYYAALTCILKFWRLQTAKMNCSLRLSAPHGQPEMALGARAIRIGPKRALPGTRAQGWRERDGRTDGRTDRDGSTPLEGLSLAFRCEDPGIPCHYRSLLIGRNWSWQARKHNPHLRKAESQKNNERL